MMRNVAFIMWFTSISRLLPSVNFTPLLSLKKRNMKKIYYLLFILMLACSGECKIETEEFGNGDSYFAETLEHCQEPDCKPKIAKGVPEVKSEDKSSDNNETPEVNVMITFTKAAGNHQFHKKFELTVTSLLKHATVPIALHILGDPESQKIAKEIIVTKAQPTAKSKFRIVSLDVAEIGKKTDEIIKPMQKLFSYKPGSYYSDALFFISIGMHKVMPESMHQVIMLDADLKFMDDIKKLHDRFKLFRKESIIGIGYDLQPVYRHTFWQYRKENPGTRVGEPGPDGLQGFNSGVLMLNLDKMRKSKLYNSLLDGKAVTELTEEFHFKGHLGDQDFFTLLSMKYEWLFHVLPCQWNRQLCRWWEDKGYQDVFSQYFSCKDPVKIYHGNCNTPIP